MTTKQKQEKKRSFAERHPKLWSWVVIETGCVIVALGVYAIRRQLQG